MIFTSWRSFVPLVRLSTAKCPIPVIIGKLREAARLFCARTRVWTQISQATDLLAGNAVYGLSAPAQADICDVLSVRCKGNRLTPLTPEQWRALPEQSASQATHFIVTEPAMVHLWPTPEADVAAALVVEVVMRPSVGSAEGPEFLLAKHGNIIAKGAQAELLLIPDRPWTDLNGASVAMKQFEDGMAGARISVDQGLAGVKPRVKYRPFI